MTNLLNTIVHQKKQEIAQLKAEGLANRSIANQSSERRFKNVFQENERVLIGEIKRRSPSKGELNPDLCPVNLAKRYQAGGVGALSVLTDQQFFNGSLDDMTQIQSAGELHCPILRKDFIIDPVQLYQTCQAGADAVLLIARLLPGSLTDMVALARTLGLDPLVEVHSRNELNQALAAGAEIIGINHRNLETFDVDTGLSECLLPDIPDHVIKIAESGIHKAEFARQLFQLGFNGLLVGESLVTHNNPQQFVTDMMVSENG